MDLLEQEKITSPNFKRHPWELARHQVLHFFLKKIPSKNFIVDIGSGDAYIAKELSKIYSRSKIAAVDPNYDDESIAKNEEVRLAFSKKIKDIESTETVDVILLMDVLEHIQHPANVLQEVKHLPNVSSSTQLFITVPAFQSLFSEHDTFLKHFRRYNREQLVKLLRQSGFEIEQSGYFFAALLLPRVFQKILGIKPKIGLHNWNGNSFTTSIVTTLLWIDFKICWYLSRIGIHLPGLSCYCICHPLPS
jgi:hypothetical protein